MKEKKMYCIVFTLTLLFACSNTFSQFNNKGDDKARLQASDLKGNWEFVRVESIENSPVEIRFADIEPVVDEEALILPPYIGPDLRFEDDSLYELDYPKRMNDRWKFSVDSGYLVTSYKQERVRQYPIEKQNDSLYLYKRFGKNSYVKESYAKSSWNDSLVSMLKSYGVNYPELAGTWLLIREDSFNDGSEYSLKFPFKLPDSISLTREELIKLTKSNMVYWLVSNGKKRDYVLSYEGNYINLTPGKWYVGTDPWIHFYLSK